ncbi:GxGYxYP domain-containing protein [Clostridium butyricum]|uniref:GxGYxYP domain-containing protein n=1 Tax=Clostridium butyricum TaxID=1492 RepID=UPI003D32E9E9
MKKILKIYLSLLFTFIFLFTSFIYPINATSDLHIIQDYDNSDSLPNSFRKTTDISNANILKSLNIKGLDKLNISGSGQFSEFNIKNYTTFNDALFNSSYIDGASNISSDTNVIEDDSYIKNTVIPKFLYVISENDMTKAEQTMIATLQGLIASKSENQIYILSPSEHDYEIWLEDLKKNYNVKYKKVKDPWSLLDKFKKYIHGYTLYSTVKGPSINNACTLASLNDSIAIDESIENILNSHGITNLLEDCRETDKYWAYNTLWNSGLNHSTVIELPSDKFMSLRDYAILSKSLIFYEDDVNDTSFREAIFSSMDNGGRILGWGPDEHTNVSIASKCGIDMIAADWSYDLSVLSSYKSTPQSQNIKNDTKEEDGVHYITFIMSDGDNMQWLLGSNFSMKNWFGSPNRGNFNLGWSITPSLYYLAPTVFNKYYSSASSSKYSDNFVVSASGNGYMYPSKFPYEKLSNYTNRLNDYMSKVDQNYVLILDDEAFYKKDLWNKYTCNSNIDALLYLNYDINNAYKGKIIWSNDKPVISCRDLLWGGLEDENELISNINNRINSGYTNIKDPNSYTFVYVHVWSNTMDNVNDAINKLNKNPKVKIVTPDTFIKLIRNNVPHVDI